VACRRGMAWSGWFGCGPARHVAMEWAVKERLGWASHYEWDWAGLVRPVSREWGGPVRPVATERQVVVLDGSDRKVTWVGLRRTRCGQSQGGGLTGLG